MNSKAALNPQNPYISAMVSASAGSGKTFQLSRRFLALVAAGADPSSIFAVTFSKKAAAEMRERIVQDAIALGLGHAGFLDFYDSLKKWRDAEKANGLDLPLLRSPAEVSELVTSSSQSLSVTTIDAILMEWCLRFPWETRVTDGSATLMQPWEIATRQEMQDQTRNAWKATIKRILSTCATQEERDALLKQLLLIAPEGQLTTAWHRMAPLRNSETFIWLCEHLRNDATLPYQVDTGIESATFADLLETLAEDLRAITGRLAPEKQHAIQSALAERSIEGLIRAGLFTQHYRLNKSTVNKKIREELGSIVDHIDNTVEVFVDQKRLGELNLQSSLLWQLYHAWSREYLAQKSNAKRGSFSDALKGVWQLFCHENPGARWMIQHRVKHLLLDEFQDTSRLQWSAFSELAKDILSGTSTERDVLPGTVFIVGDAKQSIYGFREAAPEIMNLAVDELSSRGFHHLQMSASWRTAPVILEVVNKLFAQTKWIEDFPEHRTASISDGTLAVPDAGSVTVLAIPEVSGDKDFKKEHVHQEADSVAAYIQKCLNGTIACQIWDKSEKSMRRPRPKDFAILYHAKTDADTYEEALRKHQIPAMREERRGFYDRQEIRDVVAFLKWLGWSDDTLALCSVLKSPMIGLSDIELQQLIVPEPNSVRPTLSTNLILERLSVLHPIANRLLGQAQHRIRSMPYLNVLLWWFEETKILSTYKNAFGDLEGELAVANLVKFIDTVRSCETLGHGHLQSVLEQIEIWSEDDETGNANTANEAVHLMTLHKSKGLEFPVVILVGLANDWFKSDSYWLRSIRSGAEGMSYVGTSAEQPVQDNDFNHRLKENEDLIRAEKARLLYVGMTRAQYHLVLSSGFKASKTRPLPSDDSFYMQIRQAVATAGGVEDQGALRLARTKVAPEPSNIKSESTAAATPLKTAPRTMILSELPPLSILTATARAQAEAQPVERSMMVNDLILGNIIPKHPLLYGQCVHRILELTPGLSPSEPQRLVTIEALTLWMRNQLPEAKRMPIEELLEIAELAITAAVSCKQSESWRHIMQGGIRVHRECSLAVTLPPEGMTKIASLVVGQPDLVIEKYDQTVWVVDYKTGYIQGEHDSQEALVNYCKQKGYDVQVETYAKALGQIYPNHQIKSWVFFTHSCTLVPIS